VHEEYAKNHKRILGESIEEISDILNDIGENMETVESSSFSTYKTVMDRYKIKIERARQITQQQISMKAIENYVLVLPEVPKSLETLADNISLRLASTSYYSLLNNSSFGNVFNALRITNQN
jgi:DNA-binding ferritin-like protein